MNYGVEGMPPSFPAGKADLLSTEQKVRVLFDLRKLPLRSLAAPCVEPRSRRRRSYIDPLRGFRRGSRRLSSFFLSKSCSSMWLRTVVRWWKRRTTFKRRTVPRLAIDKIDLILSYLIYLCVFVMSSSLLRAQLTERG
jgi:hypothetical protein